MYVVGFSCVHVNSYLKLAQRTIRGGEVGEATPANRGPLTDV